MRNFCLTLIFLSTFSGNAAAQNEHELLFAHFGDGELAGGNLISQLILLNPDETVQAQATITLKDDDGNPLNGIDLNGQILSEGTLDVRIPACGMRILTTDGLGPVAVGSAIVTSDKPLTGVINFSGAFGAAGVGTSERQSGFVAAMIKNATTDTGLAIMNPGNTEVTIDLELIDKEGSLLARASLRIPMMGHLARFFGNIDWQPEPGVALDLSAFEGLIKGTTTGGQIAATVIQTRPNQFITMPVGPIGEVGASELLFAHFGDGELAGGNLISQFILLNPDPSMEARATITIKNNDGDPINGIDLDGQILPEGRLEVKIPPSGMRILATDGEGPVAVGSATVTSNKPLTGVINFSGAFGAAGVGASAGQSRFVAAMIKNSTTDTGLAIMNPGSSEVTIELELIGKEGNLLARASLDIPIMGHQARFFGSIAWQPEPGVDLDLSAFEGLIKGSTTTGQIVATVIQTQTGEFVTMPVGLFTPAPIIVTSAADDGPGTLRQALLDARPGDTLTFDPTLFPPDAPTTIILSRGLPDLSQGSLMIDASDAGVILDGSGIAEPESVHGLSISSNSNTIRGLQIVGFSVASGIGLFGGAANNIVGGDPEIGAGPLGQGNLFSGNSFGIGVWGEDTAFNTVFGNTVGTDLSGLNPLANLEGGVIIDLGAHDNVIGPDNVIAYNRGDGITIGPNSLGNTITRNSIHNNLRRGIALSGTRFTALNAPLILDFDVAAMTMTGVACDNCVVEIFSDDGSEGETYEATTFADNLGQFSFDGEDSFTGPHLTATATDADGTTSRFSVRTSGPSRSTLLQEGNDAPKTRLLAQLTSELEDNRMGTSTTFGLIPLGGTVQAYLDGQNNTGAKWMLALTIDEKEWDPVPELGHYSTHFIDPTFDEAITGLVDLGFEITYSLAFWDDQIEPEVGYKRFKKEEEIERYLDYVRFLVQNFKDRIQWYEMINEPRSNEGAPFNQQNIDVADYIELVKRTVQVIRAEQPEAKIVVGATVLRHEGDYLLEILRSDVMPMVDGVSWHPFYGQSPEFESEYYYNYPNQVQQIKDLAAGNGFTGEYMVEEISYRTALNPGSQSVVYSGIVAGKYAARAILMHLGLNVIVGGGAAAGVPPVRRNLASIMAGAEPTDLSVEIESTAEAIRSYIFSLPNGDTLIALWTDGVALPEDPGVSSVLTFPNLSAQRVFGIDVLFAFEQELSAETVNGDLIVRDLLVKDYPIILHLIP